MSDGFVTLDDLRRLEERLAAERIAFETRMDEQMKRFTSEINGHIVRISEAAQNGRSDLIESNQRMVEEFHRLQSRIDRAEEGGGRHRESTAARLVAMEEASKDMRELARSSLELLRLIGNQIQSLPCVRTPQG